MTELNLLGPAKSVVVAALHGRKTSTETVCYCAQLSVHVQLIY